MRIGQGRGERDRTRALLLVMPVQPVDDVQILMPKVQPKGQSHPGLLPQRR